jgi:hypothetical protein
MILFSKLQKMCEKRRTLRRYLALYGSTWAKEWYKDCKNTGIRLGDATI